MRAHGWTVLDSPEPIARGGSSPVRERVTAFAAKYHQPGRSTRRLVPGRQTVQHPPRRDVDLRKRAAHRYPTHKGDHRSKPPTRLACGTCAWNVRLVNIIKQQTNSQACNHPRLSLISNVCFLLLLFLYEAKILYLYFFYLSTPTFKQNSWQEKSLLYTHTSTATATAKLYTSVGVKNKHLCIMLIS